MSDLSALPPQASWTDAAGCTHAGAVLHRAHGFDVVDCAHCGFRHVLPLPTPQALAEVYTHDYYRTEKPLYIERYLEDRDWWECVYTERYEWLEAALPATRRRLLDVGSGPGLFLASGRDRGWTVRGIEPSTQAARHSREQLGLDVVNGFLDADSAPTLGRHDVVHLGEVLEHLSDPAAMLRLAHDLLTPDGLLVLVVPNDDNPVQRIVHRHLGVAPWWVAPPHHLNYFDAASLAALVSRCGYTVEHQETTFPIDLFLLMGHHYIGDDAKGRQAHGWRKTLERNLHGAGAEGRQLLAGMRRAFAGLGMGREILLYARRSGD
jgi:SAM-dependent methyltransferase